MPPTNLRRIGSRTREGHTTKEREGLTAALRTTAPDSGVADRVLDLQTHDKLRLAADLLLMNRVALAKAVTVRALDEIELATFMTRKP